MRCRVTDMLVMKHTSKGLGQISGHAEVHLGLLLVALTGPNVDADEDHSVAIAD